MTYHIILAGGLLVSLVLVLAQLTHEQLLRPSLTTQVLMGIFGGVLSIGMLVTLRAHMPDLPMTVHPTAPAFLATYFGPVAGGICGAMALAALLFVESPEWTGAVITIVGLVLAGVAWRWVQQRLPRQAWVSMVGMSACLSPIVGVGLVVGGQQGVPDSAATFLGQLPWFYTVGFFVLTLVHYLLAAKAQVLSELQASNATLRQRDQQLMLALESMGGGRWEWDFRTQRYSCYGSFYAAFGVDTQGADPWPQWYGCRHPADRERLAARIGRAMAGLDDTYEADFRVRDQQGRWHWIFSRGAVSERDANGRPVRMLGMDMDVTKQRETLEALRESEAKYTAIYQTLPDPAGITRMSDGIYIDVNPAFCELVQMKRDEVIGRSSLELAIWATPQERDRLLDAYRRDGRVTNLPMMAQSQGVRIPGRMSVRPVSIDGHDCFVFVFHDMTAVERARGELVAVNALLQQAGRLARLGAWEDERGKGFVHWSDMCYEIHGLAPGSPLPGDYIDRFVVPPFRDMLRAAMRACVHHRQPWSLEMQIQRADGRLVWVRANGEALVEDGEVTRVRGVVQDIDDARRAALQLRQSEDRFTRMFQLMPYAVGLSRRSDGTYKEINPSWVDLVGVPREEAIGRTPMQLGLFSDTDRLHLMAAVHADQLKGYELKIQTRHQGVRTVLQSMRATEFDGEPCWLFAVQDITDRKRGEEHLREREELLSLTISAASLGLWDWDLRSNLATGDARWQALHGIAEDHYDDRPMAWTEAVPAEDQPAIQAEVERHLAHPDTPFDVVCRVHLPVRGTRWLRNLGKAVDLDAAGRPTRMLGVSLDVTSQREQEVLLQRLAHYDALTGLPNRVLLARELQQRMEAARRGGSQLGVAYLDLDGFKPVNDRLGHEAGDRLLVAVAGRLARTLRPHDCVARLGGDEFVLLMPELGSTADCEHMLRRVMEHTSAPYVIDGDRVLVTASIGYTLFPADDADADTLLRHADQAMYIAKQAGRNRYHQFDTAQERALRELREQGLRLRDALRDHQFVLYVQPKVDMKTGTVTGAETLARWQHPERGLLSPGAFMPLLEGSELETGFGEWAVHEALRMTAELARAGTPLPLSVNISAQHLQMPGFADWLIGALREHPEVPPGMLEIEITESAALYDLDAVTRTLTALREHGVVIALDDFGTGYSSLTYVRRLPVDMLKIDQSFVHGMMGDTGDLAIVQGVIGLARSFGHRVIAEGVETEEQGQMLLQLGCVQAQGYCIARPMPLAEFMHWAPRWQAPAGWQRQRLGRVTI